MKTIKPSRKSDPKPAAETEAVCLTKTVPGRMPVEIDPLLLAALDETIAAMKNSDRGYDGISEAEPADSISNFEV